MGWIRRLTGGGSPKTVADALRGSLRSATVSGFTVGAKYIEFADGNPQGEVAIKAIDAFMGEQWISLTNGRRFRVPEFEQALSSGRRVPGVSGEYTLTYRALG